MVLLVVNFHYVAAAPSASPRAIFPVSAAALAAQVELLGRACEFVSRDDVLAAAAGDATLPERACLITFDDGLRCQYELALPVLERLGVNPVLFVAGRPLAEGRALAVHQVHWLREHLAEAELAALLEAEAAAAGIVLPPVDDAAAQRMYRYDDALAARTKFLLNVALPRADGEALAAVMFAAAGPGEAEFCADLYMDAAAVRDAERRCGAVAGHGYAHVPLATLPAADAAADLRRGAAVLRDILGSAPRMLSYPYGSAAAVSEAVAVAAAGAGYEVAFTMERALNRSLAAPLLLARLDTNDAPGGKRPALELASDGLRITGAVSARRERHVTEALPVAS